MVESGAVAKPGRVALLGAHTAVAESLVEACDDLDVDVEWTRATTTAHVGPGLILIDPAVLGDHDAFVVAFDDPIVPAVLRGLESRAASVIDLTGHSAELDVPVHFAGLGPSPAWPAWARVPVGPAHPVVSVVAALAPLGVQRTDVVALESVASADRAGIEELSESTRAVFTLQDREPSVFAATVAFNTTGGDDAEEAQLAEELAASRLEGEWGVTRLRGASFSVETVVLAVELGQDVDADAVALHLESGRALRLVGGPLSALDATGRDDVRIFGVRVQGRRVRLVATYDRLRRGSATQVAWLLQSWRDRASK